MRKQKLVRRVYISYWWKRLSSHPWWVDVWATKSQSCSRRFL